MIRSITAIYKSKTFQFFKIWNILSKQIKERKRKKGWRRLRNKESREKNLKIFKNLFKSSIILKLTIKWMKMVNLLHCVKIKSLLDIRKQLEKEKIFLKVNKERGITFKGILIKNRMTDSLENMKMINWINWAI